MFAPRVIQIVNATAAAAEATIEAPVTLTVDDMNFLALADTVVLRVKTANEVGAVNFAIDSLSGSIDGTNYRIIQTFTTYAITANGEPIPSTAGGLTVTNPIANMAKLRLDLTVTTLDGSNTIDFLAQLIAIRKTRK